MEMHPKFMASAQTQKAVKGKKVKEEPEPEEDSFYSIVKALMAVPKEKLKAKIDAKYKLHERYVSSCKIYEDYDCMLNQTNIGQNNNKFYLIQLIEDNGSYSCWNRWGRVGEPGQSKLSSFPSLEDAKKNFEKKFWEKTKNNWAKRENFEAHDSKYTLIEVQQWDEKDSKDVKKMPLGKLSKQQIAKGFEALEAIETAMQKQQPSQKELEELSSRFYTIIPHNFGHSRPPSIATQDVIQAKKNILMELAKNELDQSLQTPKKEEDEEEEMEEEMEVEEVPHPLDQGSATFFVKRAKYQQYND